MLTFFQNLKQIFTKSYWVSATSFLFGTEATYQKKDYLNAYQESWLVNACVDRIAEAVSSVELKLFKLVKSGKEAQEQEEHPLMDLIHQVNPWMTRSELFGMTVTFLKLLGNAYWFKIRGKNSKKVLAIWPLRPDWVRIVPDKENFISEYEYRPNGIFQEKIDPKDIIHFKQPNPLDAYYGMGTVGPAIEAIKTLIFTTRWNMNFFYNSARPDALLISKQKVSQEDKEEFRRKWNVRYGGYESAHRIGILEGEVDYKILNPTAKEMDFKNLHELNVNDILSAFGVPKPVIGMTTDLNRAVADSAIYMFFRNTVKPDIQRIIEKMNEFLVPDFGDNLFLDFVDPVPADRMKVVEEYESALKNKWMVINEVRDRENLPPLEGGWSFYLPMSEIPIGDVIGQKFFEVKINPKNYYAKKKEIEQSEIKKKMLPYLRGYRLRQKVKNALLVVLSKYRQTNHKKINPFTQEEKKEWWFDWEKKISQDDKLFKAMIKHLFKSQKERLLDALESEFGKTFNDAYDPSQYEQKQSRFDLIDWAVEIEVFIRVSKPVYLEIVKNQGERAAFRLGAEFLITERINKFIDEKSLTFAKEINATTREKVRETLKDGVKEGEGVDNLTRRLDEVFNDRERWETERIVRTEVLEASNASQVEAFRQNDVEEKEWLAEIDEVTSDGCLELNGEVVKTDKNFSVGLEYPPLHSNCRCTVIPVIEE